MGKQTGLHQGPNNLNNVLKLRGHGVTFRKLCYYVAAIRGFFI